MKNKNESKKKTKIFCLAQIMKHGTVNKYKLIWTILIKTNVNLNSSKGITLYLHIYTVCLVFYFSNSITFLINKYVCNN